MESIAERSNGEAEDRVIAAAIVDVANGPGENAEFISCGATLVETDDCYLILESPLHGEYEGERFVRSVSYSYETISGSWHRWYGLAAPAEGLSPGDETEERVVGA